MFARISSPKRLLMAGLILGQFLFFAGCFCPPITITTVGAVSFEGCLDTISTTKLLETGKYQFNGFGDGHFTIGLNPAGQNLTFNLTVNTIVQSVAGNAKIISTQGDRLFAQLNGTSTGPDANNVITFQGKLDIYGGTGGLLGTKGSGHFNGSIDLDTNQGSICFDGNLFHTFTTTSSPRIGW